MRMCPINVGSKNAIIFSNPFFFCKKKSDKNLILTHLRTEYLKFPIDGFIHSSFPIQSPLELFFFFFKLALV